ncbi:Protein CBR-SRX-32 [Caenorhabditis briggsae]|uniref:Protein CBR-SRX-32 n=1 Tax=Caenorhabditis briggsae TaxID=6238 RepID=A8Y048_CAEBR|nr:Protein CBR-SRX-32 [Caenorhabditis briggsae]CAP38266.2 Protein CBR-SRX-32 [Caenorhabditis briggsae]
MVTNSFVLFAIRKTPSMKGSFGIITKNQTVCNLVMCSIFLFFVFPLQMSGSNFLISHSHFMGTLAMTIYEISNGSHFLISCNRFCALFSPIMYDTIFKPFVTRYLRNSIWVLSIFSCTYFYEILKCNFFYNPQTWTFEFLSTDYCSHLTWFTDFTFNTTATVITLLINLSAAYKERVASQNLLDLAGIQKSKNQKNREWNFVKQTCLQGISCFFGQFAYYFLAPVISENSTVLLFVLATLWAFMLAFEGGIILASNREIRGTLKKTTTSVFVIGYKRNSTR